MSNVALNSTSRSLAFTAAWTLAAAGAAAYAADAWLETAAAGDGCFMAALFFGFCGAWQTGRRPGRSAESAERVHQLMLESVADEAELLDDLHSLRREVQETVTPRRREASTADAQSLLVTQ